MKKTIATIAVAVLSFALLAGCGSKADPPVKSLNTTSPATPPEDDEIVAKAVSDFYVNLTAESLAFENSRPMATFETFDKAFPKTLAAIDLSSFETKTHAYEAVSEDGLFLTYMAARSPKVSVRDLVTIKDVSKIKVTGDKATFKMTIIPVYKDVDDDVAFNKVDGKWLLDGKRYTDAYFKVMGIDLKDSAFK